MPFLVLALIVWSIAFLVGSFVLYRANRWAPPTGLAWIAAALFAFLGVLLWESRADADLVALAVTTWLLFAVPFAITVAVRLRRSR